MSLTCFSPLLQITAVSSAGLVFKALDAQGVPPFILAAWRLQATTLVLAPLCAWQLHTSPPQIVRDALRAWWLLAASGAALALHFGAWIWGLEHTSLPHALLFVTATPLLLVLLSVVMRVPVSRGELIGAVAAFIGMAILCAGASVSGDVRPAHLHAASLPFTDSVSIVRLPGFAVEPWQRRLAFEMFHLSAAVRRWNLVCRIDFLTVTRI